jgi:hypothetical protein
VDNEPVLTLFSSGLLSKWGFNDGDAPNDVLDWREEHGLGWRVEWHPVLVRLVYRFLLPVLDQEVKVAEIETIHNPIRAETVDGVDVTDFWYDSSDCGPELTPECVEVPMTEVASVIREFRLAQPSSGIASAGA